MKLMLRGSSRHLALIFETHSLPDKILSHWVAFLGPTPEKADTHNNILLFCNKFHWAQYLCCKLDSLGVLTGPTLSNYG